MKFLKSTLIGTSSFVLAGLILFMFAPKAAHALVATLVLVANTTANPAITSNMDNLGRVAYQSTQLGSQVLASNLGFGVNFPAVPANHRLVVQHVSMQGFFTGSVPPSAQTLVALQCSNCAGGNAPFSAFFAPSAQVGDNVVAVDSPVLVYFDQGQIPMVQVDSSAAIVTTQELPPTLTLTGYMLDCSAAPCSAIAN
ncbi:MAG TPA: hypothetical protein VMU80_28305 [Bryobacteraceae bacterium]|nr:hypothetical protein [Bryobacteraceae bacterium]HUO33151.1 hypothetical protein [Bryobacteraceae bacterium]